MDTWIQDWHMNITTKRHDWTKRGLCNFPLAELGDDTVDGSEILPSWWTSEKNMQRRENKNTDATNSDRVFSLFISFYRLCPCSVQCSIWIKNKSVCSLTNYIQLQTVSQTAARNGWCLGDFMQLDRHILNASMHHESSCNTQTEKPNNDFPIFWWPLNQSTHPPDFWIYGIQYIYMNTFYILETIKAHIHYS